MRQQSKKQKRHKKLASHFASCCLLITKSRSLQRVVLSPIIVFDWQKKQQTILAPIADFYIVRLHNQQKTTEETCIIGYNYSSWALCGPFPALKQDVLRLRPLFLWPSSQQRHPGQPPVVRLFPPHHASSSFKKRLIHQGLVCTAKRVAHHRRHHLHQQQQQQQWSQSS